MSIRKISVAAIVLVVVFAVAPAFAATAGAPKALSCTATFHTPEQGGGGFSEWLIETTWAFEFSPTIRNGYYGHVGLLYEGGANDDGNSVGQSGKIQNAIGNLPNIIGGFVAVLKSNNGQVLTSRCAVVSGPAVEATSLNSIVVAPGVKTPMQVLDEIQACGCVDGGLAVLPGDIDPVAYGSDQGKLALALGSPSNAPLLDRLKAWWLALGYVSQSQPISFPQFILTAGSGKRTISNTAQLQKYLGELFAATLAAGPMNHKIEPVAERAIAICERLAGVGAVRTTTRLMQN